MAEAPKIPDEAETRARWGSFAWTDENQVKANEILGRYPKGREQSASIPLLDLAQRQVGAETQTQGWLPVPVIEFVARQISVPYMRVYEVVTFYTMFNLAPVGRFHVQVCGTTPCMLRGSDDVLAACKKFGEVHPGGIIRPYGYRVRGADLPAPTGVFWHHAWDISDCLTILADVRNRVRDIRRGDTVAISGDHCT